MGVNSRLALKVAGFPNDMQAIPMVLGGPSGVPGVGSLASEAKGFGTPLTLYLQAAILDEGASLGIALSNGLSISVQ